MIFLDSDVVIELLEGGSQRADEARKRVLASPREFVVSALTVHEVAYGRRRRNLDSTELGRIEAVAYDQQDALRSADLAVRLDRAGSKVDQVDCMIAAMAMRRGASLYTFNTKHFSRMRRHGLTLY